MTATLGELAVLAMRALDDCRARLENWNDDGPADAPTLSELALVSIACSLYRLQALPATGIPPELARVLDHYGIRDPRPAGTRYGPRLAVDPFGVDADPDPLDPLDYVDPLESAAERYVRESDERGTD